MDVYKEQKGSRAVKMAERLSKGFTLIEVTIAVLLLAVSLVALLGLEASIIQQTVRDRSRQDALLVTRRILAAIEASDLPIEIGTKRGKAGDILQQFVSLESEDHNDKDLTLDFDTVMKVEYWQVPGFKDQNLLKRLSLTVYFGKSDMDSLEVLFFIPDVEVDNDSTAGLGGSAGSGSPSGSAGSRSSSGAAGS